MIKTCYSAPSHYLNQCRLIVNWITRKFFFEWNTFWNVFIILDITKLFPGKCFFLLKLSALVEEFVVWQIEQKVFIRFSTEFFHNGVVHIFVSQFCRSTRWRLCFGKVHNKHCKCKKRKKWHIRLMRFIYRYKSIEIIWWHALATG